MVKKIIFWVLASIITVSMALYQRLTGPTYPKKFKVEIDGSLFNFELPRSQNGTSDCEVKINVKDPEVSGIILYKHFKTSEPLDTLKFIRTGDSLTAMLPGQPAAGKLEYMVKLFKQKNQLTIINNQSAVIRFKNNVPAYVLIPHILLIFSAMLLSTLAGFFAAGNIPAYKFYIGLTLILFILGGMIMGPIVQKFAFGEFWTGFPFGKDLTDNKSLIAVLFWIIAWLGNRKTERKYLVLLAAVINIIIGLIPHSARGSELDYSSGEIKTGMIVLFSLF